MIKQYVLCEHGVYFVETNEPTHWVQNVKNASKYSLEEAIELREKIKASALQVEIIKV